MKNISIDIDERLDPLEGCTKTDYPCGAYRDCSGNLAIKCNGRCSTTCPFHPAEKARRMEAIRKKIDPNYVPPVETEEEKRKKRPKFRTNWRPSDNFDVVQTSEIGELALLLAEEFSYLGRNKETFGEFYDGIMAWLKNAPKTDNEFNESIVYLMSKHK